MSNQLEFSIADVHRHVDRMIAQILREHPDGSTIYVYPIPRGGVFAAYHLMERWKSKPRGTRVLQLSESPDDGAPGRNVDYVLDDIRDSGKTWTACVEWLQTNNDHDGAVSPLFLVDKMGDEETLRDYWVVFPWEQFKKPWASDDSTGPSDAVVRILQSVGEDPDREGLKGTPERFLKAMKERTQGHQVDIAGLFTTFDPGRYDELILLKDIEFVSTCEHHLERIIGHAHVAYIPKKRIVGISKLARLVDAFAHRLTIQERICEQVVDALEEHLEVEGAACVITAKHQCIQCRGVGKADSVMVTSKLSGAFRDTTNPARLELMQLIKG